MTDRKRGAFILAHGRQELLNQTIAAIRDQVDVVVVHDNASEPRLTVPDHGIVLVFNPEQPPNLARYWNFGLDWFARHFAGEEYDLAFLCDDTAVPAGWFDAVTAGMRETGTVAGSASPWGGGGQPWVQTSRSDGHIGTRMCSWAFVVDGASKVRADESMHWWWMDTDFDIQLRENGGTVLIGTHPVPNQQPNHYTNVKPELGEQAGRDRATFVAKYGGWAPW